MKTLTTFSKIFIFTLLLIACESKKSEDLTKKWIQEIFDAEQQFAQMVQKEGIHNAFVDFAADDASIMRNDSIIKGKTAIDNFYKNSNSKTLSWTPDFIEVSKSGDLGYTYGMYYYTYKDTLGTEHTDSGIFHTVWKRQSDGTWKFVWD